MMNDLSWDEFCELYFETAKHYAAVHLQKMASRNGAPNRHVDLDYVADAAVLSALEKAYTRYDAARGARITTYLSTLVHNELADELTRESRAAKGRSDFEDVKSILRALPDEQDFSDQGEAARAELFPKLQAAVAQLSASDQVILDYYLEDRSTYIARSVEALHVSEGYVSVRRNRIFKLLPKLMGMSRAEYLQHCLEYEGTVFAGNASIPSVSVGGGFLPRPNPIRPALSVDALAERLLDALL